MQPRLREQRSGTPFRGTFCHHGLNASYRNENYLYNGTYISCNKFLDKKSPSDLLCTKQCADRNGELYSLLETASRQLKALKNKHGLEISADPRFVSKIGYSNDGLVSSRLLGLTSYEEAAVVYGSEDDSDYRQAWRKFRICVVVTVQSFEYSIREIVNDIIT